MNIAVQRRDFLQKFDCFICNQLEAGQLFVDDYSDKTPEEMRDILSEKVKQARIKAMVVTMGAEGAVYADMEGNSGICPAKKVHVKDTTGAGDAFCAGVSIGLTYGKTMAEAIEIGSTLAASVITSSENVCPRFLPEEFGIEL
jgi:pseudouridine kinase